MKPTHKEVERRKQIHESSGHEVTEITVKSSDFVSYYCSCRALLCEQVEMCDSSVGTIGGVDER